VIPPLESSTPADADATRLAWATWPADLATPVQAFLALRERGRRPCLLESVEGPARLARYTFLGAHPAASFRGGPGGNVLRDDGGERSLPGRPHDALRAAIGSRPAPQPPRSLPPFCGGWVGWLAFEWASALEPSVPRAARDPWGVPDATFELYEDVLAFDHASQRLYAIGACPGGARDLDAARERLERLASDALALAPPTGALVLSGEPRACMDRRAYLDGVRALQAAISAGECFQAVLSQRFELAAQGDPFALYRVLRLVNPSPHMFFFEADGLSLIGSSPERLVAVRDGLAETRPIAGTRPRGADEAGDERLARELYASDKERAEHDMLVDLARNDLGRVARVGTVGVREHMALERFARVQHLVSRVDARLAAGRDALDALAACFPAGTVSGAPKVRALQLLAGLETDTRGPYAGCFGYVDARGALDMALSIRTFTMRDEVLAVQAGAGVVFDSDPEAEHAETLHKADALFEAARLVAAPVFAAGSLQEVAR
jgi:anthranilate synthase component 1